MNVAAQIPTGEARAKLMKRDYEYLEDEKVYVAYTLNPEGGKEVGFEAETLDLALDEVEAYDNLMARRDAIAFAYDEDSASYTVTIKGTGEVVEGDTLTPLYLKVQEALLALAKASLPESEPQAEAEVIPPAPKPRGRPKGSSKPKLVEAGEAEVAEPQIRTSPEDRQEPEVEFGKSRVAREELLSSLPRSEEQRVDLSQTEAFFGGRDYADPRDRGQTTSSPFTDAPVPERKQRAYRVLAQAQQLRAQAYDLMAKAARLQGMADEIAAGDA